MEKELHSKKRVRMGFVLAPHIAEYIQETSEKMGMNKSAFLTMLINNYIEQNNALKTLSDIADELKKEMDM
ncbi:hypothetical protein [Clostridium perfringens]|uniref:hypothetical protein n=1 Tax=Clostridium perfringens TaxID=1502 RepID=UPI0018E48037|nr:hypothetical protein [Clostridium perfringens]MBI6019180.1 hypothetical protein [Clostridium perfringens]